MRTTIYIEDALHAAAVQYAEEAGMSVSALIRGLLRKTVHNPDTLLAKRARMEKELSMLNQALVQHAEEADLEEVVLEKARDQLLEIESNNNAMHIYPSKPDQNEKRHVIGCLVKGHPGGKRYKGKAFEDLVNELYRKL